MKKFIPLLALVGVFVFVGITHAQDYDCTDSWYNDERLVGCTDCNERCSGSLTYKSCILWCEGNNFCNNCTPCPTGQTRSTSGSCICASDSCCQGLYGEGGIYANNDTDGCACADDSTWNGSQCLFPTCGGDYIRHENGTCICKDNSCCERLFGYTYWDGNGTDGCRCKDDVPFIDGKCQVPQQSCSAGMHINSAGVCACEDDSCCQAIAGDAIFTGDSSQGDGCTCMSAATAVNNRCVCSLDYTGSPEQRTCICKDDGCCTRIFGDAHYNYSAKDGCSCNNGKVLVDMKCVDKDGSDNPIPTDPPCPEGVSMTNGECIPNCEDGKTYNSSTKACELLVIGKVIHIDFMPFTGAEIAIRTTAPDKRFTGTTEEAGVYKINTEGITGKAKVSASLDGYIKVVDSGDTSDLPVLLLATKEEYEQEVRDIITDFLKSGEFRDAKSIGSKLKFNYTERESFQYQDQVIYIPNSGGENYWRSPDWDTMYHEVGHYLMDAMAYDNGSDIGHKHELDKSTTPDTAYDEGRAHLISILFLNFVAGRETIAKAAVPGYGYNWDSIGVDDGAKVENIVTKFWADYYGSNIQNNPGRVLKDLYTANNQYHNEHDFERYPRTITEWIEGKATGIWGAKKAETYSQALDYNRLIRKANNNHIVNDFPYIAMTKDSEVGFDPVGRVAIVFAGRVHIFGGRMKLVMYGKNAIEPYSDFVLNVLSDGTLDIFLQEGKLIIKNATDQIIGEILPEDGFKQLSNNTLSNLPEERRAILDEEITMDRSYQPVIEQEKTVSASIENFKEVASDNPWIWILLCGGTMSMMIGGLLITVKLFKGKKGKGLILGVLPFICVGCTLGSLGTLVWLGSDDGTVVGDTTYPPNTELQGFVENNDYNYSIFLSELALDMKTVKSTPDWAVAVYDYCYKNSDISGPTECPAGTSSTLNISVLNLDQYRIEVEESPMKETYTLLGTQNDLYFVMSYPNGAQIEGAEIDYDSVAESFEFI